jgi:hypothetical protein
MMPENPYAVIHLNDYPKNKILDSKSTFDELLMLREGGIVEISIEGEIKFYVLENVYNYLSTCGYILYNLKRTCNNNRTVL